MKHLLVTFLLVLLAGLGCKTEAPRPDQPQEDTLRKLRLGLAIPSYVHAVAWIAQEKGFFAKHGLDVDVRVVRGSASTMKALLAEDLDLGLAGGDSAIKANLSGADLKIFGSVVSRHYHRLVTSAAIQKPEDLRGKTVGLPVLGGPQDFLVYVLCHRWGLEYGKDVKAQVLGRELARLAAIVDGRVAAVSSALPSSKIRKLGLGILADPRSWDEPAPYMMMVGRSGFLTKNRALTLDFMRALAEAQRFYMENEDEALRVVFERLGSNADEARECYAEGGPQMFVVPPTPDTKALAVARDYILRDPAFSSKGESFRLEDMVDGSFVTELEKEGIYDAVAAAHEKLLARQAAGRGATGTP